MKYEMIFGNEKLFDGAPDDAELIGGLSDKCRLFYRIIDGDLYASFGRKDEFTKEQNTKAKDIKVQAMRRIIKEPKRWTVEDKKAGRLPDIGYKFEFTREQEKAWAYLNGKEGWKNGDILEVIHTCVDHDGDWWAIVINTDPEVLSTASLRIDFFTPEETPDEKAQREEDEFVSEHDEPSLGVACMDSSHRKCYELGIRAAYRKLKGGVICTR